MKVWKENGKHLTEEYMEAHEDLHWAIHAQKAKLDASLLAITGIGGRGVDGALEELYKMEKNLLEYKDLQCLKESSKNETSSSG